nr:MAG TPA: hypothetical protein [Caudoviricetes sp.]
MSLLLSYSAISFQNSLYIALLSYVSYSIGLSELLVSISFVETHFFVKNYATHIKCRVDRLSVLKQCVLFV